MTITLLFAIVIFVYSVYCPPIQANEFPSYYPLRNCKSNSPYLELHPSSSTYKFVCSEEDPLYCNLMERDRLLYRTSIYPFKRATVEFISMEDDELTLMTYPCHFLEYVTWDVTCNFLTRTLAQKFYKLVTRDRQSELVYYLTPHYLLESDDTVLAEHPKLYLKGGEHNIRVVIKNATGDPVLIFPQNAVSEKIQHEADPTKIDLHIAINRGPPVLYKFGFTTRSQALYLIELLNHE